MSNDKRKEILKFLLLVLFFALITGYAASIINDYFVIKKKNILLAEQIQRIIKQRKDKKELIKKKKFLSDQLTKKKKKYYKKIDADPYNFGVKIKNLLVLNKLIIKKYQTIESKGNTILAFSVSGDMLSFFRFLKSISKSDKYIFVLYISINSINEKSEIESTFRVTYGTIDE